MAFIKNKKVLTFVRTGYLNEQEIIAKLKNEIYPIGSIYTSINSTSPATLFGGTWEQLKDRFLLATGDSYAAGTTGGEATHTLTTNEMPSHNHTLTPTTNIGTGGVEVDGMTIQKGYIGSPVVNQFNNIYNVANAGGGQAHNNMPPYLTVYMWKRTA